MVPTTRKSVTSKKVTKAGPASALAFGEGETEWSAAELDEVLVDLREQRERLDRMIELPEEELNGRMRDSGDGAGHDQADVGATSCERAHELIMVIKERETLAQVDRALSRIDEGSYGVCEACGQAIGKMRVMAFPRATLCLSCKQREERR